MLRYNIRMNVSDFHGVVRVDKLIYGVVLASGWGRGSLATHWIACVNVVRFWRENEDTLRYCAGYLWLQAYDLIDERILHRRLWSMEIYTHFDG